MRKTSLLVLIPSVIAFFGVILYTYGATTISTSIVTGGDLTVSGAAALSTTLAVTGVSTLTDDLVVDTDTLYVDASTDRTGVGTTTPSAMFSVGEAAGTVTGDVYFTGGLTLGNAAFHSIDGAIAFGIRTADPTAQEGLIYYNSTSKVLKMSDGTNWFAVGTTTSGLALSGAKISLSDLTTQYMTFGTTSQSGLSVLTLEATTTDAIPFTIRGYNAQTANLLQVQDVASANLFYITSGGNVFATGTLQVTGNVTTYGAVTAGGNLTVPAAYSLDTAASGRLNIGTSTANAITIGKLGITTTFPGVVSLVNASSTLANFGDGTTIARILHGTCTLVSYAAITASSTGWHDCQVTGVTTDDRVLIQLPRSGSDFGGLFVASSRASTTADYIGADIFNLTGLATSSYTQATTSVQYWVFK